MKRAWVLSGGGAKGAFQVGVMKKLLQTEEYPDVVYGTSVGAINAFGLAHAGIDKLEGFWRQIKKKSDILSFNFLFPFKTGMYSMNPLKKRLGAIPQDNLKCDYHCCYIDMKTGVVEYGKGVDSVLSSSCIPGIMELIHDRFADGGIREQAPVYKAIDDGATEVTVILCNPLVINPVENMWKPKCPKIISSMMRAVDTMEHEVFVTDLSDAIEDFKSLRIIAPDKVYIDTLEFNQEKISCAIDAGLKSFTARVKQ